MWIRLNNGSILNLNHVVQVRVDEEFVLYDTTVLRNDYDQNSENNFLRDTTVVEDCNSRGNARERLDEVWALLSGRKIIRRASP